MTCSLEFTSRSRARLLTGSWALAMFLPFLGGENVDQPHVERKNSMMDEGVADEAQHAGEKRRCMTKVRPVAVQRYSKGGATFSVLLHGVGTAKRK